MGDWTVRLSWNQAPIVRGSSSRAAGFHDNCLARRSKDPRSILAFSCYPVIEEHQVTSEVPEFTIEVRYVLRGTPTPVPQPGWKYTLRWLDAKGQENFEYGYGYDHSNHAKARAEDRATEIAKVMLPTELYTYTPEV